ncbi:phytanoyl-CoA dioxygenase family protein [Scytonema sp. UIC 10036]|uniref:phytanoyl-CoA dioxygenase family protein n=1 Tax=Scytonema sp. UIC 10036 TaxID=2304196 RepID=UPI0012DAEBBF|nr:phytanoyl-CoA dioxygenase family protein [Scytonema sp. UIC 10036]MUG91828.1 phytanoyl-CoA dioxygenase family protein [Scytonema sp. UIC 10036]
MNNKLPLLTDEQITQFREDGFLVVENLLDEELVNRLINRFEPIFSGEFETGIYPDDLTWNPNSGIPNSTRQVVGVWRSDLTCASVVLSEKLGQMTSMLGGWNGARFLGDSIYLKPYGASETVLHQDLIYPFYPFYHQPLEFVGCWIALSDAIPGASTIEYVKGSHRWLSTDNGPVYYVPGEGYLWYMEQAAKQAGVEHPEVSQIQLKPGSCTFHHCRVWHGSGRNVMPNTIRRCLAFAHIPAESRFRSTGEESYIPNSFHAGRYKRYGDDSIDESFFPIVWRQDGYRSSFLADYCDDALAKTATFIGG